MQSGNERSEAPMTNNYMPFLLALLALILTCCFIMAMHLKDIKALLEAGL